MLKGAGAVWAAAPDRVLQCTHARPRAPCCAPSKHVGASAMGGLVGCGL